ncbi:MAG: C39 family peptidase [Deltaproteobacteria bacterium]|jgi:ABC-type bacteriocin/lantibiotic exporter with double-glycine peptidase domain|nr:C39 family peptidase [Deltaproteobacteria bacterium]
MRTFFNGKSSIPWLLVSLLFLSGCLRGASGAPSFVPPEDFRLIEGVPFFPDDSYLCGPASVAAVLSHAGYPTTLDEARRGVSARGPGGSLGPDLVIYARERGASASFFSASAEELTEHIGRGVPLIVEVDYGFLGVVKAHFMVIVGYSPEGVVANTGTTSGELIPWASFLSSWKKMAYFAIRVEGKGEAG